MNIAKDNQEGASWIWQASFVWRAVVGALVCTTAVYIVTMPRWMTPLYESEAIVYAPLTIQSQQLSQQGIGFASDKEIDWYMQLLKSNTISDSLAKHFSLYHIYSIEIGNAGAKSILYQTIHGRVVIEKTRYGSVSIRVRDTAPTRAAAMANDMVSIGETVKATIMYPNRQDAMNYARSLFDQRVLEITSLQTKLDSLQQTHLSPTGKRDLTYQKSLEMYNLKLLEMVLQKDEYKRKKKEFDTPLSRTYIISQAVPSAISVSPRRGLLCLVSMGVYWFLLIAFEIIKRDILSK
jgi:hypothetical protein